MSLFCNFNSSLLIICFCCLLSLPVASAETRKDQHTLCRGTNFGLSASHDSDTQYEFYRAKYTNCTYVDGNLELVFLNRNYDLSFLKSVREVTGYVLIVSVMSSSLSLTNLRIIRGQSLYRYGERSYGLFVASNFDEFNSALGLRELQFVSLHEIITGDVYFHNNLNLCFEDTVNWDDILASGSTAVYDNPPRKSRSCPSCDLKCAFRGNLHCWGEGPNMCQNMTKLNCSRECADRCVASSPGVCCHSECAGGCTGPTNGLCWACKRFENEGQCVTSCPLKYTYDRDTLKQVPNPFFKYSHGSVCLSKCPSYMVAEETACVRECEQRYIEMDGMCTLCDESCPKRCMGTRAPDFIHAGNINNYTGCVIIQGSISILQSSFTGLSGIREEDLSVFETVTQITGYLQIEADAVTQLDYFRNLRVIRGVETVPNTAVSLKVSGTRLKSLDLQSLKEIRYGNVFIQNNSLLCYADSINWRRLFNSSEQMSFISNQKESVCAANNQTCAAECSSDGCWGPGNDQCLSCAYFSLDKQCLMSCDALPELYQMSPTECGRCHPECEAGCTDNTSSTCFECKHVQDGLNCSATCPKQKYADSENICRLCHVNCEMGCTGDNNTVGPGGCNSCALVVLDASEDVVSCLPAEASCADGYFKKTLQGHRIQELNGKQACKRCHPECRICDEYSLSLSSCKSCLYLQQDDQCVRNCSSDYYIKNQTNICSRCDSRCLHCTGPTASDCTVCKQYVVYHDMTNRTKGFNCTETCPDHAPHKIIEDLSNGEKVTVCVKEDGNPLDPRMIGIIVGSVIGGVILVSLLIVLVVVLLYKRAQAEANKVKLTAQLYGVTELEPLKPSGINPDLANIKLINESELRRGAVMGKGAFGTVFKGLWIPESENVKLVVAIKVLAEGKSPRQSHEMLEEARIMASVNDQYCIRILAFCLTAQMMIITQLMPHGCLLDFIRKNKENIGSKVLLNWCTQIAKGMAYLEERSIVHRDLAARNILVQHPEHLRITDFGLSKLLDYNENFVRVAEDKVPIKWMALESIQNRIFTHKSDVWSYGVTLWELFELGGIPYEHVSPDLIEDVLVKGERLSQPKICTIDVYMLMIKCWVIDSGSRPTFRYLAEEFAKMARDPGRYLVIPGDEYMRLSSPTYEMKDLIRYVSIDSAGGGEMLISADDYLNPRGRIRSAGSQSHSDHLDTVQEVEGTSPRGSTASPIAETQFSGFPQRGRRNSRNKDPAALVTRQHSEPVGVKLKNSHFFSDPGRAAMMQEHIKTQAAQRQDSRDSVSSTGAGNSGTGRGSVVTPGASKSAGTIVSPSAVFMDTPNPPLSPRNSTQQQSPVRECDYLQPTGDGKPSQYMDLMDNTFDEDTRPGDHADNSAMTSFISNPEYFDSIDETTDNVPFLHSTHKRSGSQDSANYYNEFVPNPRTSSAPNNSSGL